MIRAVILDRDDVLTYFDLRAAAGFFGPLLPIALPDLAARWETYSGQASFFNSIAEESPFLQTFWHQVCDDLQLGAAIRTQLLEWDYTSIIRAHPDAAAALRHAKQLDLATGVLSNFHLPTIDYSLQVANLAAYVDRAITSTQINARKPAARAYQAMADLLQVAPHECLFFDNEPANIEGALQVGMHAYLVDRSRSDHDLDQNIVRDLSALAGILAEFKTGLS